MSITSDGLHGDTPTPWWRRLGARPRGIAFALLVEFVAVALVAINAVTEHVHPGDLLRAGLLGGTAVIYAEAADRFERVRRFLYAGTDQLRATPTSAWTFAAVLILPPVPAFAVIVVIYAHSLLVGRRDRSVKPFNIVFDCATIILAAAAAGVAHRAISAGITDGRPAAAASVVVALLIYTGVSLALALTGLRLLYKIKAWRDIIPARSDAAFELATLVLGIGVALFIQDLPWLTPILALLVAMLHRTAMITHLQAAARTDGMTGLLNATAWRQTAGQHLARLHRDHQTGALLVLDLDHFKRINDQFGHPAGDTALRAVAECLRQELRGFDAIGRHGGEEFVALLSNITTPDALTSADRVRLRISEITHERQVELTVSIGVALYPSDADTLDELFQLADAALYTAKEAGRNRVRLATSSR